MSYLYSHGSYEIYQGPAVYSTELTAPSIGNGWYESVEYENGTIATGKRIMVKKVHKNGLHVHYVTTKIDYGWVRRTVVFRDGEADPYPVDVDQCL